jgi:integrase
MQGFIVKRELKDGSPRYFAVFRAAGKKRWKGFPRRKDAERFLTATVKSIHDGSYQDVRPVLLGEVFDRWLTDSLQVRLNLGELKPSTSKSYRSMIAAHLRPAFGDYRSDQLAHATVSDWVKGLSQKLAAGKMRPQTFNNLINLLHSILSWSRLPAQSFLNHNPMLGQKRLRKRQVERDFLEPIEIDTLLRAATPPNDTLLHVCVYTGMRRGELFAAKWSDINWGNGTDGGRIKVRRSIYQGAVTSPKTENSIRDIDVTQRTLDELQMYRLGFPPLEDGFIFRQTNGRPIDPDNWQKDEFLPLLQKAEMRRIGLHTLRHTYASLLINAGESLKYVSKQLGHGSIAITADTYGHLFQETSRAAMERLGKQIPSTSHLPEQAETASNTVEEDGTPKRANSGVDRR